MTFGQLQLLRELEYDNYERLISRKEHNIIPKQEDKSSTATSTNDDCLENKPPHVQIKAFQTLDEVNKFLKKIPYSDFIDVRILSSDSLYYVIYLE